MRTCSLRVEPQNIIFPPTYISSTTRFTIKIYNDTKSKLHFQWRKRETEAEDQDFLSTCDINDPEQRQTIQQQLEFESQFFKFEEITGEIWPSRSHQTVVSFEPELSINYTENAYLYVIETGERFHVTLQGLGLAPDAQFSVPSINIGHVFLESILEYEVVLENVGKANVEYYLEKKSTPGLIFEFTPSEGMLPVNQKTTVHIKFIANHVGSFNETFTYQIKGAVNGSPTISFYGKVIGPTFSINTKSLDYGIVSYGFMYSKTIEIENKSEIPFDYALRLSQDSSFSRREFAIKPSTGTIDKFGKQQVVIEFIPVSIQNYQLELYFDISKYGEVLAAIPITAKCICPEIELESTNLDLGSIFIGHAYSIDLILKNDTEYPAKYEYVPTRDSTQLQAKTFVPKPNGTINPHSSSPLQLLITPIQLGPLLLTQHVRIYGDDGEPRLFTVSAICVGPIIKMSISQVDFGKINVLQNITQQIAITNDSTIPAIFTTKIEDEYGVYECSPKEATIPPNETLMETVAARLDDNINFNANLVFLFQNLNPIVVPLRGNGIGTTIRCSVPMNKIDMGYIFSERPIYYDFILSNQGRKPQEARWTIHKPKTGAQNNANFSFKICPESVMIPAYDEIACRMIFQCNKPSTFSIGAQCYTSIRKKRTDLFNPKIQGTFVRPELQFSQQTLEFHHIHDIQKEEQATGDLHTDDPIEPAKDLLQPITAQVTIKNVGHLALNMKFNCPKPFSISESLYYLEPDKEKIFDVMFDPSFKKDFISELITKKIAISYDGHPQINYITLKGFIEFPNVTFSPSTNIEFGNLMLNTEQTKEVTITNTSGLPVDMYWELFTGDKLTKNPTLATKIFDIYPIRKHIEPQSQDVVRFSFFAVPDPSGRSAKYKGTAVCHIVGGPEYVLNLSGGSAAIQYKIDPQHFDLDEIGYKARVHEVLTLTNHSDVAVSYHIKIPRGCTFNLFIINPEEGVINQNETKSIDMYIIGGLPKDYNESFFVQIGHYDEVRIDVLMKCFIPQIQIDLAHTIDDPLMTVYNNNRLKNLSTVRRSSESDDDDHTEESPGLEELAIIERDMVIRRLTDKSQQGSNQRSKLQKKNEPVCAKYLMDFGKIVFGESCSKTITAKSRAPLPISFDIQTSVLEGTGFSIEPVSFVDVPPNEDISITVTFDTKMRTNDLVDDVEFEVPILLNEDVGYRLVLKAFLEMPILSFSQTHCDFGNVIVGQSYVITIQLQNMNPVSCDFKFGEAQFMNLLQRGMSHSNSSVPVFVANPSSGSLPPQSFLNVELSFLPMSEKSYSMQFPITIKYNTQLSYITLKGYGVQLKVNFEPNILELPPLNPFCEPTYADVKLINPTQYPITVLSPQFDLQLLVDQLVGANALEHQTNDEESLVQFTNTTTAKFSICVIVSGVHYSGKTTVSKAISKYLNVPILSLKEIWKDVLENHEASQADYVEAFSKVIAEPEYNTGFVIDGLDCLPDPADLDPFLQHCLKQKHVDSELAKNPLTVFQHPTMCGDEQALSYVLAALDGHYVFHVALKASEEIVTARDEVIKSQEKRKKRVELHQEKKKLFNMSEEQYLTLTEEEQEEVDKRRQSFRKKMLKSSLEAVEDSKSSSKSGKSGSSSSKHRSHSSSSKSKKEGDSKPKSSSRKHRSDKEGSEKKEKSKKEDEPQPARKHRSKGLPTEPIPHSVVQYQFTVGSLAQRAADGGEYFQVVDPIALLKEPSRPSTAIAESVEDKEILEESENSSSQNNAIEEERVNNRNPTPMVNARSASKDKIKLQAPIVYTNMNTIIINVIGTVDEINAEVLKFIPSLTSLKEKAFTYLIPPPRLITTVPNLKKITLGPLPHYFSIVVEDPINDVSELFPETHHNSRGKKSSGRKSRTASEKPEKKSITIPDDIDLAKRTKRWEIPPESEITLSIMFDAKLIGNYNEILTFNILNSKTDTARLQVRGICAYPDIDRTLANIFPKIQRKVDSEITNAFSTDAQEFHFGSVLVIKERTKNQIPQYHQSINLHNISLFPTEITASLTDVTSKNIWWVEKNSFVLQPDETSEFQFGAHPVTPDTYRCQLLFTIKDHPEPIYYSLVCEGCAPIVEISNSQLDFEKILLSHTKTLSINFTNTGKLPAFWRVKGTPQLGTNFTFNQLEGSLKPRKSFKFESTFESSKALSIKKNISLEILDLEKTRVFSTLPIGVTVEAFDVNFDYQYPKGIDHLNFGMLKVGQTKAIPIVLKNKGKYPSQFKISVTPQRVLNLFTISPIEGVIQPGNAPVTVTFTFCAKKIVTYQNSKGVILSVIDSLTNVTTAEIPLSFSAQTVYSSFTIDSLKPIDFGSTPANVPVTKSFKITNNGVFPFEYEVTGKEGFIVPIEQVVQDNKKKKTLPKSPVAAKARPRKGNDKSISIGSFFVIPSAGIIQPKATAIVEIDYNCLLPGESKSTALIRISDMNSKQYPEGLSIDLNGMTYVPGLNTTDYSRIFQGTEICLRFDLERLTSTTAFLEDEHILHFAPLILQTREVVPITLINPQPIPITVDISLQSTAKGKPKQANFPFEVSEKTVNIEPNGTTAIDLIFAPITADKFQVIFEANVKNGTILETKCLRFGIEAIGTLPTISMISQVDLKSPAKNTSSYSLNLGKTLVGFTKDKAVAIKNDGLIPARIQITTKPVSDFILKNVAVDEEFILEQNHILNLPVVFQPDKVRKSQFEIGVFVLDNPKANLNFIFIGEGYSEDVSFEGLSDDDGNLIFKDNIVGRQQEATFVMRNVSQNDLRFQWNDHNDFVFYPKVGQIRVGKIKTIKVVFFTEKPQKLNGIKINCQWTKIELADPYSLDWDDSQKAIKFVTKRSIRLQEFEKEQQLKQQLNSSHSKKRPTSSASNRGSSSQSSRPTSSLSSTRQSNNQKNQPQQEQPEVLPPDPSDDDIVKITEIKPEPEYAIIPGKYKDLQLKVIAISDYIKYSLDTTEIEFSPTMMFQSRVVECKITNTSSIKFDYQWITTQLHCLRSEYDPSLKPPFSVLPTSGCIEAGQTTVFKVKFEPEEVDDFSAVILCDIPYLTQMKPPQIKVTGFSRRPLCHFNVEMSDYLSAGRRHPDYVEELPPDTKVIELFSPAIGTRSTKKFEIINPTSSPYEIAWSLEHDDSNGSIFCDSSNSIVSSGKRHTASFTYLPNSVKTVESLYEFQIPEHNIRIPVLIVGRIMPKS